MVAASDIVYKITDMQIRDLCTNLLLLKVIFMPQFFLLKEFLKKDFKPVKFSMGKGKTRSKNIQRL